MTAVIQVKDATCYSIVGRILIVRSTDMDARGLILELRPSVVVIQGGGGRITGAIDGAATAAKLGVPIHVLTAWSAGLYWALARGAVWADGADVSTHDPGTEDMTPAARDKVWADAEAHMRRTGVYEEESLAVFTAVRNEIVSRRAEGGPGNVWAQVARPSHIRALSADDEEGAAVASARGRLG